MIFDDDLMREEIEINPGIAEANPPSTTGSKSKGKKSNKSKAAGVNNEHHNTTKLKKSKKLNLLAPTMISGTAGLTTKSKSSSSTNIGGAAASIGRATTRAEGHNNETHDLTGSKSVNNNGSQERKLESGNDTSWSAIDTLDDVKRLSENIDLKDGFLSSFEQELAKTRESKVKLLNIMRDRNYRLEKKIDTQRVQETHPDEHFQKDHSLTSLYSPEGSKTSSAISLPSFFDRNKDTKSNNNSTESFKDSVPIYISDYINTQNNIVELTMEEKSYVNKIVDTIRENNK